MPVRNAEWECSVEEVKQALASGKPMLLIDVREPDEHRICRIDGAVLIPLGQLPQKAEEIRELAAGRPVVAHCHHGGRSLSAAAVLRESGIAGVKSMAGGIDEWSLRIDPAVPRY